MVLFPPTKKYTYNMIQYIRDSCYLVEKVPPFRQWPNDNAFLGGVCLHMKHMLFIAPNCRCNTLISAAIYFLFQYPRKIKWSDFLGKLCRCTERWSSSILQSTSFPQQSTISNQQPTTNNVAQLWARTFRKTALVERSISEKWLNLFAEKVWRKSWNWLKRVNLEI